jgi:hypothetical protein
MCAGGGRRARRGDPGSTGARCVRTWPPVWRQIIKNNGYLTKDAQVTARGRIIEWNGTSVLDLLNGTELKLTDKPRNASDRTVEVTGVSRVRGKGAEQLTATVIK